LARYGLEIRKPRRSNSSELAVLHPTQLAQFFVMNIMNIVYFMNFVNVVYSSPTTRRYIRYISRRQDSFFLN
jgi:hypothetical protein